MSDQNPGAGARLLVIALGVGLAISGAFSIGARLAAGECESADLEQRGAWARAARAVALDGRGLDASRVDGVALALQLGLTRGPDDVAARFLELGGAPATSTPGVAETWEAARASSARALEVCSPVGRASRLGWWTSIVLVLLVALGVALDGRRNQIPAWWAFALATPLLCAVVLPLYLWRRRAELGERARRAQP